MTDRIAAESRRYCDKGTEIVAVTASFGCEVIASRASFAIAGHAALDAYAKNASGVDAVLLACFGDPGLEALREISTVPVYGLLESALARAGASGRNFATLTAGPIWVEMLNEQIRLSPYNESNCGVFAAATNGLSVSRDPEGSLILLQQVLDRAIATGADAVMLGGSALAGFAPRLASGTVELVDPLQAVMRTLQDGANDNVEKQAPERPLLSSIGLDVCLAKLLSENPDKKCSHLDVKTS